MKTRDSLVVNTSPTCTHLLSVMHFCNECDDSFSRKDDLVRHHLRRHPNSGTLASLLRSLSVTSTATDHSYEPKAKRAKLHEDEESEENETDDESDATASNNDDASSGTSSDPSDDEDDLVASQSAIDPSVKLWEVVQETAEEDFDGNVLDAYISLISSWRLFKKDVDHQKIMETVQRYREGSDAMDFHEALLKAVNKRKHLIRRKTEEAKEKEEDEQ